MNRFFELWGEITDLDVAVDLLSWDQETMMPPGGSVSRAEVAATIAGLLHRALVAPELSDRMAALIETDLSQLDRRQIEEAQRRVEGAVKVPEKIVTEIAAAASRGVSCWQEARRASDFGVFAADLENMIELQRQRATALDIGEEPYDSLLDDYEPGLRATHIVELFEDLRTELPELVSRVAESGIDIDEDPAHGTFDEPDQLEFGRWVAARFGFDFDRGRIDRSAHPFCSGFNRGDVRLTWRPDRNDFRPALLGVLHETGHGLYEQGLPTEWQRAPLGVANSMGIHESQSQLWENHVGRHRGFWKGILPRFQETFSACRNSTLDEIWPTLHPITPSLVRVEADETTYPLHIAVRFEIERALISGNLDANDLPAAWAEGYARLLGVQPRNDVEGLLQDIHWAMGLFGYFPTYALGSLLSAQIFEAVEEELGDQTEAFEKLEFDPLLGWLREKIHRHGCRYSAIELTRRATGKDLSSAAFLRHVKSKAAFHYGVPS